MKSLHTWAKTAKNGNPHIGNGRYGRVSTEQFIVCRRGKPDISRWLMAPAIPTIHHWPRPHGLATKPPEAMDLWERVADPATRRIELFARTERPGWDCIGDQIH